VKVRDVIATLEADGWHLVRTRGSHRQFRHPLKRGTVTVAGKTGVDRSSRNIEQHLEAGWKKD
jgi:predicted RNA binding protein YcfA (HicA-like mRNA interferase family)